jgi:hypothetical protein
VVLHSIMFIDEAPAYTLPGFFTLLSCR